LNPYLFAFYLDELSLLQFVTARAICTVWSMVTTRSYTTYLQSRVYAKGLGLPPPSLIFYKNFIIRGVY